MIIDLSFKDSFFFFFSVWVAPTNCFIQGSVWMDNERDCEDDRSEEQLHILWCIPSTGEEQVSL